MNLSSLISTMQVQLSLRKEEEPSQYGLYFGKAGMVILYFCLSQYTKQSCYTEKAKKFLDDISNNIGNVESLDFIEGLAGIGWMIEWVKKNGFIDINTDKVLEEVDDTLYKSVLYAPERNLSLKNGGLGKAVYFLKRYEGKNPGTHRFKIICHQECLGLLTDEFRELLLGDKGILLKRISNYTPTKEILLDLGHLLIFIPKILFHKINVEVNEKSLYAIIKYVDSFLQHYSSDEDIFSYYSANISDLLYLAYAYHQAGVKLSCQNWREKGIGYFNRIMQSVNKRIPTEIKIECIPMLCRLYNYTNEKYYLEDSMDVYQQIDVDNIPIILKNGIGGLLLSAISYDNQCAVNWDETILLS